jgi:hypothetical protein
MSAAAVATAGSTRKSLGDIYRPSGPKIITTGAAWTSGGFLQPITAIDLSLPLRGVRIVFKGRVVIGTANFTSFNPEGFLNLISNIQIYGTNARQKGNVTLWNTDLATLNGIAHLHGYRNSYVSINSGTGETIAAVPSTPFATIGSGNTGTYDFRVVIDMPFHPFVSNQFGAHPNWVPGFLVRNEEWRDSLTISMAFGAQAGAGAVGALGTSAGTTTVVFSSYGSGAGSPTVDVYSLPIMMGLDLKDQVLPGLLSRNSIAMNAILQSAGNPVTLATLQKQPTSRIYIKTGVGTVPPAMSSLSDTNLTQLGVQLGGNRNVRNLVDIFAHKAQQHDVYARDAIQGYALLDFLDSGNPDSSFPGQNIGDGATFQLQGNVAGVANAQGIVIQEQMLHVPTGALYTY